VVYMTTSAPTVGWLGWLGPLSLLGWVVIEPQIWMPRQILDMKGWGGGAAGGKGLDTPPRPLPGPWRQPSSTP